MKNISQRQVNNFWTKVDVKNESDCWEWQGCKAQDGYGAFGFTYNNKRGYRAHRFSALLHGIDCSNLICHKCDNPSCVNPHHLFAGTHKDNAEDCVKKDRHARKGYNGPRPWNQGTLHQSSKLTESDVLEIRKLAATMSQTAIARAYNIHPSNVSNIVRRLTWSHI